MSTGRKPYNPMTLGFAKIYSIFILLDPVGVRIFRNSECPLNVVENTMHVTCVCFLVVVDGIIMHYASRFYSRICIDLSGLGFKYVFFSPLLGEMIQFD